jgi:hypothetical protein
MSNHTRVGTVQLPLVPADGVAPLVIRVVIQNPAAGTTFVGGVPVQLGVVNADYVHFQALPQDLQERIRTYVNAVRVP